MAMTDELLVAFECHQPDTIRTILKRGLDPNKKFKGKPPIDHLIEMYLRSPKFVACLKVMLEAGATIQNPAIQAVLLDDDKALRAVLKADQRAALQTIHMSCTFTSLKGVSLLHVCAEYNSVRCAKVLLKAGLDANVWASVDREGFGGHTPLFHTVNSHTNYARPMMELLIDAGADVEIRLKGLVWGGGFPWETVLYDVTPLSYTQCGLIKQFQRDEEEIYSNLALLYQKRYGTAAKIRNVPNKYLRS